MGCSFKGDGKAEAIMRLIGGNIYPEILETYGFFMPVFIVFAIEFRKTKE